MKKLLTILLLGAVTSAIAQTNTWWESRGCVSDARGKWFRDAKFGAFIHFGVYSQLGGYYRGKGPYRPAEQIMGLGERKMVIPWQTYQTEVAAAFNPTNFNAREWVSLIKRAGQKYVIVTTKHHDGFCMFRTATTRFNALEATPFARDVIKELADECRRQGIVFCPYYSIGDWSAAEVMAPRFKSYEDYMAAQLRELMTQYGDIPLMWFDNYWYVNNQWSNDGGHAQMLYNLLRSLNPNVLVNDRCGQGAASMDGDYATPENQLRGSRQSRYFEVVMTNTDDDNWGWVRGATNYRSAATLIRNLIDCTSKGGNFVLNVGPTASGDFPPEHVALINTVGTWLDVNGEAIYGTSPATEVDDSPNQESNYYATKKGSLLFLHLVKWPADRTVKIQVHRTHLLKVTSLDSKLAGFDFESSEQVGVTTLKLKLPEKADPYATVIKLQFASE
ncbi:MAG: alpha-L-fucosidase [Verrucomicrobiota bacterium]